ncbi:MAG: histidine phosphatase family protein [Ruminococcus sp.]|nr:histidine phosphatase family protein [Ruminococcus sp.]
MRLLVIRHGESEADILGVHEGRADFELTERGHRQAEATGVYVAEHYKVDRIFHSTLKRAAQTARHLAENTGAPLFPDELLMEFNNGLLAGLPYDVASERYPSVSVPPHKSVYKQESKLMFRHRAEVVLSVLLSENDDDSTVAVVTHGGMIGQLYRAFLRLPYDTDYSFWSGDACIHEWLADGENRTVVRANFCPHNI